jgi:hypothetical protein
MGCDMPLRSPARRPLPASSRRATAEPVRSRPTAAGAALQRARRDPTSLTPADLLTLQRAVGNQAVGQLLAQVRAGAPAPTETDPAPPLVQRLPYAATYSLGQTRRILNESEGRGSPVNNQAGHPRQHVGHWEKAEKYAEQQGRTKSVFTSTGEQDKAVQSALSSASGQAALAQLDAAPNAPGRQVVANVSTEPVDVKVVRAKKKRGAPQGQVKSWTYQNGRAQRITMVVDSMGTGQNGDIHIQTAYPVLD